ncbi:hypothetical protein [Flavobacterium selenitireducens]|uniref:hypothetical protein n=1 Tax=Flavobacterium selenitireducens TaxID=2722704 RepID=UPI00168BC61B|nr:hypothetical protein [Flavobacterium selenitireducens]MBD3581983.1 hypothetical protein [Flavobacterium selenitireducens]
MNKFRFVAAFNRAGGHLTFRRIEEMKSCLSRHKKRHNLIVCRRVLFISDARSCQVAERFAAPAFLLLLSH